MSGNAKSKSRVTAECAVMIALAAVLGLVRIVELPYGGSVTAASMLPLILIAYRHGFAWGVGSGLVCGTVELLLGMRNLSYFTTWQSVAAVVLLDYLFAFAACAAAALPRRAVRRQVPSLTLGVLLACLLRYLFHVTAGATVWAGLSIPDSAALGYSLIYNATYMIPETIVTAAAACYLASVIDFRAALPARIRTDREGRRRTLLAALAGLPLCAAVIVDIALFFPYLQDAEDGRFTLARLGDSPWQIAAAVTALALLLFAVLLIVQRKQKDRSV